MSLLLLLVHYYYSYYYYSSFLFIAWKEYTGIAELGELIGKERQTSRQETCRWYKEQWAQGKYSFKRSEDDSHAVKKVIHKTTEDILTNSNWSFIVVLWELYLKSDVFNSFYVLKNKK